MGNTQRRLRAADQLQAREDGLSSARTASTFRSRIGSGEYKPTAVIDMFEVLRLYSGCSQFASPGAPSSPARFWFFRRVDDNGSLDPSADIRGIPPQRDCDRLVDPEIASCTAFGARDRRSERIPLR